MEVLTQAEFEQRIGLEPSTGFPQEMLCDYPPCQNVARKRKGRQRKWVYTQYCCYSCSVYDQKGLGGFKKYARVEKYILAKGN